MQHLTREILADHPVDQFARWFEEAQTHRDVARAEPVCVSTIGPDGFPDSRMVLLKSFDHDGFVFFTNMHSTKARSLLALPRVAMCFYWEPSLRQVRVQGAARRVGEAEAEAYWRTRPRDSRIAAWASDQSAAMPGREVFEARFAELSRIFEGREVPRPAHWSGFRVVPHRVEFWQDRPHRLHDRFVYTRTPQGTWEIQQLYP